MTKKKEEYGLPLNTIILATIVLIVLVMLVLIFTGRIGTIETFNPDKHMCDEWTCNYVRWSNDKCDKSQFESHNGKPVDPKERKIWCTSFRDKTPCEFNPNSEDCICEERNATHWETYDNYRNYSKHNWSKSGWDESSMIKLTREWTSEKIGGTGVEGYEVYFKEVNFEGNCLSAIPKHQFKEGEWVKFNKDYAPFKQGDIVQIFMKQIGQDIILAVKQSNGFDRNIEDGGFQESVDPYEPNECEKGNPDWIEEKIFVKGKSINTSNYVFIDEDGTEFNLSNYIGVECIDNNFWGDYVDCFETTCREKTSIEILKEFDCDYLQWKKNDLLDCKYSNNCVLYAPEEFKIKNLEQAWREKECQI